MYTTQITPDIAHDSGCLSSLELAAGSVAGHEHRRRGRGRQDAFANRRGRRSLVAVVADGCGSSARSEVGAELGAGLVCHAIGQRLEAGAQVTDPALWQGARKEVIAQLAVLAAAMGGDRSAIVSRFFLFTVVGVAVTPARAAVFSIGDGLIAINGEVRQLGPFADNQPPYLGYELLDQREPAPFNLDAVVDTADLASIVIATDGALELPFPITELVGDERLFRNRDALRRRLANLAEQRISADWDQRVLAREGGVLGDDTTVVVVRRGAGR